KRYAMGPVWRADRPGKGRFREFAQCDVDVVGSASPLADAEVVCALTDALDAVGVRDYRVLVNSRQALSGLLRCMAFPPISAAVCSSLWTSSTSHRRRRWRPSWWMHGRWPPASPNPWSVT